MEPLRLGRVTSDCRYVDTPFPLRIDLEYDVFLLKLLELFDLLASARQNTQNVKTDLHSQMSVFLRSYAVKAEVVITYSLAQRPALANGHLVALLDAECRRNVCRQILVPFLVSRVLWHEVKVLATNDESAVHLCGNDSAGKDPAADGDHASKGAFLV